MPDYKQQQAQQATPVTAEIIERATPKRSMLASILFLVGGLLLAVIGIPLLILPGPGLLLIGGGLTLAGIGVKSLLINLKIKKAS